MAHTGCKAARAGNREPRAVGSTRQELRAAKQCTPEEIRDEARLTHMKGYLVEMDEQYSAVEQSMDNGSCLLTRMISLAFTSMSYISSSSLRKDLVDGSGYGSRMFTPCFATAGP